MSFRTLSGWDIKANWPASYGTSGTLVITLDRSVVGTDAVEYPKTQNVGRPLSTLGFHFESAITVSSGVGTCASIANLPTTDTAIPVNTARYNIYIYDSKGKMRETLGTSFHLHESVNGSTTSFTWQQWVAAQQFSQGNSQLPMIGDRATMQAMVDAALNAHASNVLEGITYLDTAPALASHPEAVGSNSPLVLKPLGIFSISNYGAIPNTRGFDGTTTASSTTFTSAGTTFTSADTGKIISIEKAGAADADIQTTITYVSAHTVTLGVAAGTSITGKAHFTFGIDNTTSVVATKTALEAAGGGTFYVPTGDWFIGGSSSEILLFTKPVIIEGAGWNSRLVVLSGTGGATDIIRIYPPVEAGQSLTLVIGSGGSPGWGEVIRDLSIVSGAGTPGRRAIFFDGSQTGAYIRNTLIEHVSIGKIGSGTGAGAGSGIVFDNGSNANGSPFGATIRDCDLSRGILMNSAGDTISIYGNRFAGPQLALEYSCVTGATTLNFHDNNSIASGGIWIKRAWRVTFKNNIIEMFDATTSGGQHEGVQPYGSNGAAVDFDGVAATGVENRVVLPVIYGNVISSLTGPPLNGLRLNFVSASLVDYNTISVPAGKQNIILDAGAVFGGTVIGDRNYFYGASTSVSTSTDTTLQTPVLASAVQGAITPTTGHINITGTIKVGPVLFANLGTPLDGVMIYCSDATPGSNPATGGGSGSFVFRVNGAWRAL